MRICDLEEFLPEMSKTEKKDLVPVFVLFSFPLFHAKHLLDHERFLIFFSFLRRPTYRVNFTLGSAVPSQKKITRLGEVEDGNLELTLPVKQW